MARLSTAAPFFLQFFRELSPDLRTKLHSLHNDKPLAFQSHLIDSLSDYTMTINQFNSQIINADFRAVPAMQYLLVGSKS